ncbi:MAG: extracellular solute-binding protein [Rhodococcus sp. (in: high G+C Gram-positive bacteria)]
MNHTNRSHLYSRRGFLRSVAGAGAVAATGAMLSSCGRLTGSDIAGRDGNSLVVAILGTSADAAARETLLAGFREVHPEIDVRLQPIQGADWGDFFAKIMTQVAAGNPPDVVYVATEGTQLFAEQLAIPLDDLVRRDAVELGEYFGDVHPSLVESMMYEGSLYQMPIEFNAANVYFATSALEKSGLELPPADWTLDDLNRYAVAQRASTPRNFVPYYWTNRMWGGVVPFLFANGTNLLTEEKAPGGQWMWDSFYQGVPSAAGRGGGYRWEAPQVTDAKVVDTFEFLNDMIASGASTRPESGGGEALLGLFSSGNIGMTTAGGFWAGGLADGGMSEDEFDVQFFPRGESQRQQYGAAGYAIMRTTEKRDAAWEFVKYASSRPAMESMMTANQTTPARRSMVTAARYAETGPKNWSVFYDSLDRFPDTGPIPSPSQQAAVQNVVLKNVTLALNSPDAVRPTLSRMQNELEVVLQRKVG